MLVTFRVETRGARDAAGEPFGLRERASIRGVLERLGRLAQLGAEPTALGDLAGRVLAQPVAAIRDLPAFRRAAFDGWAVRALDVAGASTEAPRRLEVVGISTPGAEDVPPVGGGQAVQIATGAPVPEGADTVLPGEMTRDAGPGAVMAIRSIPVGKHVVEIGEEVRAGSEVFATGRLMRPQDAALLASLGLARVAAIRRPRVWLLVTGDELVAVGEPVVGTKVADSNSVMLGGLVARDHGLFAQVVRVPDGIDPLRRGLAQAEESEADLIFVSGGTSMGSDDHAHRVLAEKGEIWARGLALRPGGPAGVGALRDGRPVLLLPGNPLACLCVYELIGGPVVRLLGGRPDPFAWPYRRRPGILGSRIVSLCGRTDLVRVTVTRGRVEPVLSVGAGHLASACLADGMVRVPEERGALEPGEEVEVLGLGP